VTFSYKVYAIFVGTDGSRTLSAPSATATVTVTLDWGAVASATGYHVFQIPRLGQPQLPFTDTTVKKTSLVIDSVQPGQGGTVCVSTIYELNLKDDTARSCVWVVTQAS